MGIRIDQKSRMVDWFLRVVESLNLSEVDGNEILATEKKERNTKDLVRLIKKMAINHPSIGIEIAKFEITAPAGMKNFKEGLVYKVKILPVLKGIGNMEAHNFLFNKKNIIMAGEEGINFVMETKKDLLPSKFIFSFDKEKSFDEMGHLMVPSLSIYEDGTVALFKNNHPLVANFDCILCFSEKRTRK